MRPENRWNKGAYKRKRGVKNKGPLNGGAQATKSRSRAQSGKPTESSPVASDGSSPPEDGVTPRTENNENDEDAQGPPSKQRRANSEEPRKSSDTSESRWHVDDPMEALRRAIQSSPVRNLERRDVPASDKDLTPKPVRRALFPSSHSASKPLGETSGNTPRRSPRTASRETSKQSQDKENQAGADEVGYLFVSPTFDSDLSTSPTPQRRNTRADVTAEKRLSVPPQSPSTTRKEDPAAMTPTKLTAQKLQRIQGASTTPRQSKSPRQPQSNGSELPLLPDDGFNAEALQGMETIMADMFENDSGADLFSFDPSKYSSAPEWAGWFTSDAASAVGSDEVHANGEQSSGDFINSILADPAMQKENMQFDPFALGDSNVLDSGFFGSESLNQDVSVVGSKKASNDSGGNEQGQTANSNA
ncbi:GATA transcription factor [Aspergillus sp. HF37]|nr:GATA transcription factor [Aspergillus sp. HF37]